MSSSTVSETMGLKNERRGSVFRRLFPKRNKEPKGLSEPKNTAQSNCKKSTSSILRPHEAQLSNSTDIMDMLAQSISSHQESDGISSLSRTTPSEGGGSRGSRGSQQRKQGRVTFDETVDFTQKATRTRPKRPKKPKPKTPKKGLVKKEPPRISYAASMESNYMCAL